MRASMIVLSLVALGACSSAAPQSTRPAALSPDSSLVVRRVWADVPGSMDFGEGSPSPDGRFYSFTDWTTGDLAIHDLISGGNRHVTAFASGEDATRGVFSPDGRELAYAFSTKASAYDLRLINVDGTGGRVLLPSRSDIRYIGPAAWSPDGRQLLVVVKHADASNQLVLLGVRDGSLRVLKSFDWRWPGSASFSADGKYIAYDFPPKESSPDRDIYVLAVDATRETRVIADSADQRLLGWTPDGGNLLFSSSRRGAPSVWMLPMSRGAAGREPFLAKADVWGIIPGGFSRKAYFYGVSIEKPRAYTALLDGEGERLIGQPTRVEPLTWTAMPDWSPDGKQLAYTVREESDFGSLGPQQLVIRSADGNEARRIALDFEAGFVLGWAPDGKSVALRGIFKGAWQVRRLALGTGKSTLLVPGNLFVRMLSWTPDGKSVLFPRKLAPADSSSPRVEALVLRDVETGAEQELLRRRDGFGPFSLSPDGRQLAFAAMREGDSLPAIQVLALASRTVRVVYPKRTGTSALSWTADGQNLLFAEGDSTLIRVDLNSGSVRRGFSYPKMGGLRIHPDGRRIAFGTMVWKSELWMMEHLPTRAPAVGASPQPR